MIPFSGLSRFSGLFGGDGLIVTTSTTPYPQNEDEAEDGDVLLGHVVD